jgi:hypothetical protein
MVLPVKAITTVSFINALCKTLQANEQSYKGRRLKLSSLEVALMAIFAAFSAVVVTILPGIPVVGASGASIRLDAALAPIYGMIIGPYLGFTAALFGGLVTAGSPFDILTSFSPAISAFVAGMLTQKNVGNNESKIKGWMVSAVVLVLLILGWYSTGIGQQAPFYPMLHVSALVLILATRDLTADVFAKAKAKAEEWQTKPAFLLGGILIVVIAYMFTRSYSNFLWILPYLSLPMFIAGGIVIVYGLFGIGRISFVLAIATASYCGVLADHMLGNLVFIESINVLFPLSQIEEAFLKPVGLPNVSALFMYMVPVSALERTLFTAVATIVGVGLILALRKANLFSRKL